MIDEKEIKEKKLKRLVKKLRNKYKLLILNDETLEERFSFRLSRLNVFIVIGATALILITATIFIVAFTPLREYIPGYTNVKMQKDLYATILKADSLQDVANRYDLYFEMLQGALSGKAVNEIDSSGISHDGSLQYDTITLNRSIEDSFLRAEIENLDKYNLNYSEGAVFSSSSISSFFFFTPLKGKIINGFNPNKKHFGVDIIGKENEAVKSTLDGTVIFSAWTLETGYIIGIQHKANILSIYKHNSALLKKDGNVVKAGEAIAIIGNSGELTTGSHLHFELWYNGNPVDPQNYMAF